MKILKRIFVFALFAFAAVLAFGAIKVSAAEANTEGSFAWNNSSSITVTPDGWSLTSGTTKGFGNAEDTTVNGNSFNAKALNVKGCTLTYVIPNDQSTKSINLSIYALVNSTSKSGTCTITAYNAMGSSINESIVNLVNPAASISGNYTNNYNAIIAAGLVEGSVTASESINKISLYFNSTANVVLAKIALSYTYSELSLQELDAPTNVAANYAVNGDVYATTATFTGVANATSYTAKLYKGETAVYEQSNFTSGAELAYYVPGTYTLKVIANGDGESYSASDESVASASFEIKAIEKTISELNTLLDGSYSQKHYYRTSGLNVVNENNYSGVTIYNGNDSIVIYGNLKVQGSNGTLNFAKEGLIAGDIVTVEGTLKLYNTTKELVDCYYVSKVSTIAVGVQTADAGEGKQHVRLVGGLNVNYEDVTALTFTITDGVNNTTIVVKNVFGTLTANNAYGEITEITAASLGFESLFALTITNIPAGTTLNVTATYTTASGTYTSAVKTVEVPAAQ